MDNETVDALFKMFTKGMQVERARHQMTLGSLIKRLSGMRQDIDLKVYVDLHSYRGYYEDLSIGETCSSPVSSVSELLTACKEAVGKSFEGCKGGEFVMGHDTPLWVAEYGKTGKRLIAVNDDGSLVTKEDE